MALPRVQPIRPTWRKQPFDAPDWLFDVKYDGFRGLCYVEQGRGRFISRNGNVLSRCDALGDQVATALDVDEAVIDGEVIAADETGRPQFYDLLRGRAGSSPSLPMVARPSPSRRTQPVWLPGIAGLIRLACRKVGCREAARAPLSIPKTTKRALAICGSIFSLPLRVLSTPA